MINHSPRQAALVGLVLGTIFGFLLRGVIEGFYVFWIK